MKQGFKLISNISPEHNEQHRQAFFQPETIYVTNTVPTVDNTKLGEQKIYWDGTDYYLYIKVSKLKMIRFSGTVV
jgi:hypothetical protein